MALVIDDPEIETLAHQLANISRAAVSDVVAIALREQLVREQFRPRAKPLSQILEDIHKKMERSPRRYADKTDDEVIGYNELGLFD